MYTHCPIHHMSASAHLLVSCVQVQELLQRHTLTAEVGFVLLIIMLSVPECIMRGTPTPTHGDDELKGGVLINMCSSHMPHNLILRRGPCLLASVLAMPAQLAVISGQCCYMCLCHPSQDADKLVSLHASLLHLGNMAVSSWQGFVSKVTETLDRPPNPVS